MILASGSIESCISVIGMPLSGIMVDAAFVLCQVITSLLVSSLANELPDIPIESVCRNLVPFMPSINC